jgi:hypothetical protein
MKRMKRMKEMKKMKRMVPLFGVASRYVEAKSKAPFIELRIEN